jgi:hypothetical protein
MPASVADHVTSHRGDFTAFRLGPLRSLCAALRNGTEQRRKTLGILSKVLR